MGLIFKRSSGKFHAKKVYKDGVKIADSKSEFRHLKIIESSGVKFEKQKEYQLIENQKIGKTTIRGVKYLADFVIFHNGKEYIIDSKGYETDTFKIKAKLMLSKGLIIIKVKSDKQMLLVLDMINNGKTSEEIYNGI